MFAPFLLTVCPLFLWQKRLRDMTDCRALDYLVIIGHEKTWICLREACDARISQILAFNRSKKILNQIAMPWVQYAEPPLSCGSLFSSFAF